MRRERGRGGLLGKVLTAMFVLFVFLVLCGGRIVYLPHYEKKIYENTSPVTPETLQDAAGAKGGKVWAGQFSGYPTEGMETEEKDFESLTGTGEEKAVCLEVEAENLIPTGIYKCVYCFAKSYSATHTSKRATDGMKTGSFGFPPEYTKSYFRTLLSRNKAIYAQYYVLTLEDGQKILVLLNDTAVEVPEKGKMKLPYAVCEMLMDFNEAEEQAAAEYNLTRDENGRLYYLDAAEQWMFLNKELEEEAGRRYDAAVLLRLLGAAGAMAVIIFVLAAPKEWFR